MGAAKDISGAEGGGRRFADSPIFDSTYGELLDLVEETAAYLEGAGRRDAEELSRNAALAYATESARLATRLAEVATWLIAQQRSMETRPPTALAPSGRDDKRLPPRLAGIRLKVEALEARITRLDTMLRAAREEGRNPLAPTLDNIRERLGGA